MLSTKTAKITSLKNLYIYGNICMYVHTFILGYSYQAYLHYYIINLAGTGILVTKSQEHKERDTSVVALNIVKDVASCYLVEILCPQG